MARIFFSLFPFLIVIVILGCAGEHDQEGPLQSFSDFIVYKHPLTVPRNPVCADFNGDGLTDVAVVEKSPFLNIFLNTEKGLQPPVKYETYTHNTYLAALDIDSDGDEDLVPVTENLVGPLYLNENGSFSKDAFREQTPKFGFFVTSGEIDGNGRADLVVLGLKSGELKILFNQGRNSFRTETVSVPRAETLFGGTGLREALIHDLDGDGLNDILVADYSGQRLLAVLNKGSQFTVETLSVFDSSVSSIGIFDQPGRMIIAAALESAQRVVLLEKVEKMNVRLLKEFAVSGYPKRIAIKDMDGNGTEDLIISMNTRDSSGYIIKILFDPAAGTPQSREVFLPGHDCTYLSLCTIYNTSDFLCSDINRNQFFILKKDIFFRQ